MNKYIPAAECEIIKNQGVQRAKEDFVVLEPDEKKQIDKSSWCLREKWTIIWAMEFAKCKPFKNSKERCAEWQRIFFHHCPDKLEVTPRRITTQKTNILKQNVFCDEELTYMKTQIQNMIEQNLCPLENPIRIERVQYEQLDDAIAEATIIHVSQPNTPESHLGAQPENTPPRAPAQQPRAVSPPSTPVRAPENIIPQSPRNIEVLIPASPASPSPPASPASTASLASPASPVSPGPPEQPNDVNRTLDDDDIRQMREEDEMRTISDEIMNVIEEVRNMSMKERPRLINIIQNKTFKVKLSQVNNILQNLILEDISPTELNITNFGAALYLQRQLAPWYDEQKPETFRKYMKKEYPWKVKIQKKIQKLRAELSLMLSSRPLTKNLVIRIHRLERKYKIKDGNLRAKIADHQATIKGLAAQARNKERKINQRVINKKFAEHPRKVYRDLKDEDIQVEDPPEHHELETFWRPLYENEKQHTEGEWIKVVEDKNRDKGNMPRPYIDASVIKKKILEYGNFKTPGVDKIPNFWIKKLEALHPHYANTFNKLIDEEIDSPEWLTQGSTTLLPKSKETKNAKKYRPICCLTTTYKLLTGIIADSIYDHLARGEFLEEEQKGCIRNRMGTKDQLLINKTILEDARRRQRKLNMAWIDYKKAFDSVPPPGY